ncbi:MAG: hypothetical protein JSS07_12750, partial [Proteobacteria bacterium]|nr:hypothetical protein [Pseudomonadota bacterium]
MSKILRRFVCGEYLGSAEQKETRPYYATACLLMCDSEFRGQVGGGRSLGELQRQGSETNHVGMLLKLLNAAMDIGAPGTAGPGTVVDVYFVRVPGSCAAAAEDRGLVAVIIGVGSLATMQTWTLGLRKILSARGHGAKAVGGCDASHFGRLLNACMHPRIFTRAGLPTGDNYMYDDLTSYVDDIAAQHVQAEQQQQQGGGGGDGVALVVTREALQGVEAVEPRKLLNPFLALNARRVCVSETVLDVWPSASFLCSDLEGSVFRDDGRLDFGALPEACRVYRMALGDMSTDAFFPDQLPKTEQLAQLLQGMYPSLGSVLAGKTRAEICESVLEGRATGLTAEEGGPVTFPHPLRGHPSLTEEVTSGTLSMGYLSEIEGRIARARGRGVDAEELRRLMVRSFALATNLMMTDKDDTPYGPQCVAREMLAGLRKHGLHFVRPRDRPCGGSGAWVGWVLQQLDRLGMLTHDVSIGLRMLMATLTTHMCDDGGVQLFLTGAASDGKTFAVGELLRRVVVSLQPMSSVSKRALDSAQLGVLLRNNVAFFDDVKPGMLEGIETEMKLLMGRKTKAGRATNMDFNKPQEGGQKAGSGAAVKMMPSPSSVVMTSNFLLRDVVAGSEKGIVGGSAFESRMFNYKLKPVRLEGRDVTLLSEARAGEEQEHEDSSALRYFYSCCSFVALCMSAKIVPMPVMSGHGELVRALSGEFRKLCAAFLSDDQRVMMHMNNLPIAAAIMEQVYERVVMGGTDANQRAELTDLCEIFYDIAESLLPTVEHVVFGASMVMDSANGLRDQASVVAGQLLAVVRAEWY